MWLRFRICRKKYVYHFLKFYESYKHVRSLRVNIKSQLKKNLPLTTVILMLDLATSLMFLTCHSVIEWREGVNGCELRRGNVLGYG